MTAKAFTFHRPLPTLLERMTPEAQELLQAVADERLRNDIINILGRHHYWTQVTVGEMHAILVQFNIQAHLHDFASLFNSRP